VVFEVNVLRLNMFRLYLCFHVIINYYLRLSLVIIVTCEGCEGCSIRARDHALKFCSRLAVAMKFMDGDDDDDVR